MQIYLPPLLYLESYPFALHPLHPPSHRFRVTLAHLDSLGHNFVSTISSIWELNGAVLTFDSGSYEHAFHGSW